MRFPLSSGIVRRFCPLRVADSPLSDSTGPRLLFVPSDRHCCYWKLLRRARAVPPEFRDFPGGTEKSPNVTPELSRLILRSFLPELELDLLLRPMSFAGLELQKRFQKSWRRLIAPAESLPQPPNKMGACALSFLITFRGANSP